MFGATRQKCALGLSCTITPCTNNALFGKYEVMSTCILCQGATSQSPSRVSRKPVKGQCAYQPTRTHKVSLSTLHHHHHSLTAELHLPCMCTAVRVCRCDRVIIPVHEGNHWTALMVDVKAQRLVFFDSLMGENRRAVSEVKRWVADEAKVRHGVTEISLNWSFSLPLPQQGTTTGSREQTFNPKGQGLALAGTYCREVGCCHVASYFSSTTPKPAAPLALLQSNGTTQTPSQRSHPLLSALRTS